MGQWRKLGQICDGLTIEDWACGYAAVPTAIHRSGDIYRVYVSTRDRHQRSRPAWIDVDIKNLRITETCSQPVLPLGELGTFDDSGVMPTWVTPHPDGDLMYYIGWNQGVTVPFRNSIGLARQQDSGAWRKLYEGPILDRSRDEPHFVASCAVIEDAGQFHNWYLSCTGWSASERGLRHHYHIKYAASGDGIDWQRDGHIAIDFIGDEYAISRPSVLRGRDGRWHMWFSARGDHYQIFKATSHNALDWTRSPHPVLSASKGGWDGDMVCYPFVFEHAGERFMFFNGNGYGRSGLGLALWEGDLE